MTPQCMCCGCAHKCGSCDWRTRMYAAPPGPSRNGYSVKIITSANNAAATPASCDIIRMTSSVVGNRVNGAQGCEKWLIAYIPGFPSRDLYSVCLPLFRVTLRVLRSTSKNIAMPVEHQNANPVIIEPAASSDLGTPSTFLAPAFNGSSSSSSSDSFRPHSQGSSATSPSEYLAPASGDIEPYALTNIRPPTTPDVEPLPPPMDPFSPTEPSRNTTTSSTFGLSERAEGSTYSNRAVSLSSYCPTFARGRWPEHSLGVFGLVASLVGLLFIGVRTYKLAVISTENSTIEGCTGLIQVSDVTNRFSEASD